MSTRPPLSTRPTAQAWIRQFGAADQPAAAELLDAMLLLTGDQVSAAIRKQLYAVADQRKGRRKRIALYAEREFAEASVFPVVNVTDLHGRVRRRSVGSKGPEPVKPIRGSGRVGSEGLVASVISQAVGSRPSILMNHPGPDRLRAKTSPAGTIAIVTDFIGSGRRVASHLDAFWRSPSVRAWVSRGWIDFMVVAAAATAAGAGRVRSHRLRPTVHTAHIAPTIGGQPWARSSSWLKLVDTYGPERGRGASRWGFGGDMALMAFDYRLPNNTPAMLHSPGPDGWRPLYVSEAPTDLHPAFGLKPRGEQIRNAATELGVTLAVDLAPPDATLVMLLSLLHGRWRPGAERVLAERTGLEVPDVMDVLRGAVKTGLITGQGRLTDAGQRLLQAGQRTERRAPEVPSNPKLYYPMTLRAPRRSFSLSRLLGRP